MRRRPAALLLALAAVSPAAAAAEEGAGLPYTLDTTVSAGYRIVDIDGAKAKYREDYNLRSGFRLFDLDVDGRAKTPDATRLDRFHLEVETPGDEPVSHFRLTAADRTLWDLRADFTRSKYFYQVPQLFELPVAGDLRLDDLHDFDLVRTNGLVDLTLRAPHLPTLLFGYRLYERHGDGVSTVGLPAGDTFLVRAPVDTTTHVGRLGTEFRALDTDVFLQQEYRRVDRGHDLGPVRAPLGLDPADGSDLTAFRSEQEEHLDIPATTVRVRRQVGDRLDLTGAYFYSHADLGFDRDRRRTGTTAAPFGGTTATRGSGGATLDTHVADAGSSLRITDRVRVDVGYRLHDRSQNGTLDETTGFGALALATGHHVRVHSVTGDVTVEPREDLSLDAGVRYARRDARFALSALDVATDTVGAIGGVRWRPLAILDLFARYENVQIDDPLTAPGDPRLGPGVPEREVALTFRNRATAGARVTPREWATLAWQLVADSQENERFGARTRSLGNTAAVTLTPLAGLTLFGSYTRRDVDAEADIVFPPLYARALSLQAGSEDVLTSELRFDFERFGQRWSTGWNVAWVLVENRLRPRLEPGLAGRRLFDLDRIDGGAFLAWHHRVIEPSVEFRLIDYGERVLPRNDYRGTMLVFKLTRRWSL
ncbi:MAG TPA: hypothetical protein VKA21_07700 [Candidatus Binatia bacterium]|nr:hypothetical protein [Candidatus Binatia bacterium]